MMQMSELRENEEAEDDADDCYSQDEHHTMLSSDEESLGEELFAADDQVEIGEGNSGY